MKLIAIAMLCHSINAAYCQSMGYDSQPTWDDAPDWQRNSAIAGVEMHLANPDAAPEQSHQSWYKQKEAEGWKYGEVKDPELKEHPCFLPYEELPQEQKAKDYLFKEVVKLAKDLPDLDVHLALSGEVIQLRTHLEQLKQATASRNSSANANVAPTPKVGATIKYVGNKDQFVDNIYDSNLTFEYGQSRTVTADLAGKLLKHPEFKRVEMDSPQLSNPVDTTPKDDTDEVTKLAEQKKNEQQDTENATFDAIALVGQLDKDALNEYAMTNFNEKLNKSLSLENTRKKVINLIETQGAPK